MITSIEDANLAKKDSDQEGCAGRVGGDWQEEREPGGDREHGGGEEVHLMMMVIMSMVMVRRMLMMMMEVGRKKTSKHFNDSCFSTIFTPAVE